MKVYVVTYGYERDSNVFGKLESAKEFVQDQQSQADRNGCPSERHNWVWHFLVDDDTWYFSPDKDDDTPEETWTIVEEEVQ